MGACYGRLGGAGIRGRGRREGGCRDPCVKTQPLKKEVIRWKSEMPITMGQLNSKRDEFWETAPAFDGRKEIWDALKAASMAVESTDYAMAQAILDGANIYIPHGTLVEAYDELGNSYKVPIYCLSRPLNILCEDYDGENFHEDNCNEEMKDDGEGHILRLRLSTTGRDVDLNVRLNETITCCKGKLGAKVVNKSKQRWFYGGKLIEDKTKVKDLSVQDGHIIQVVFLDFQSSGS